MKIASILDNVMFDNSRVSIKVLLETDFTKEIRVAMKMGQQMKQHQSPLPIVVMVVDGKIDFGVSDERITLSSGEMIALEGAVPHDLIAQEDSIVRLTLSKSDHESRVEQVVN